MEHPTKASLRTEARRRLRTLSAEDRRAAAAAICARIAELREWAAAGMVGLYAAQAGEPDVAGLLRAPGKRFCFPRVAGEGLEFRRCDDMGLLRAGRWNLLEPNPEDCAAVSAQEIDLLLIPGLAFTRGGGRLGRGGGVYDRFLAGVHPRAVKIGVCFDTQLMDSLPLEGHDHEVDLVVTQAEVFRRAAF